MPRRIVPGAIRIWRLNARLNAASELYPRRSAASLTRTRSSRSQLPARYIRQLVSGNWIRTILWTVNALVLLVLTAQLVAAAG